MKKWFQRILKRKSAEKEHIEMLYKKGLTTGNNFNCFSWYGIDAGMPWLISIGDDVTISSDVHILTHDASTNKAGFETKIGLVKIGNNCFVGVGSIILCNVTIGDNVIIGAGSVVTHDIPSNSVVGGNPAKVITSFDAWKKKSAKRWESQRYFNEMPWQEWFDADEEHRKMMKETLEKTGGYGFF